MADVVSPGVDEGGVRADFGGKMRGAILTQKCEVLTLWASAGLTPLRGRSRLSKVDLGGVQGQAQPSGAKGSGPLRTCQSDSDAGWTGGLGRVWPGGQ